MRVEKQKILALSELAAEIERLKQAGKVVAHCHGVFDLMHVGHIKHLQEARALADVLVVTVTPDKWVNKGPGRPVFTEALRMDSLAALECVSFVGLNEWPSAVETIACLKPSIFIKGGEFKNLDDLTGNIQREHAAMAAVGGRVVFTSEDVVFSSSNLINTFMPTHSQEMTEFLMGFKKQRSFDVLVSQIAACRKLKVLIIGETIIDEYQYCQVMGKSGKEPILAARYMNTETFAGGVLAAANHVASFCDHVWLESELGEIDSHEEFVRANTSSKVEAHFSTLRGCPTIVKRRFLEFYPLQKLFEVYVMNDSPPSETKQELKERLKTLVPQMDMVLALDYGHGTLDEEIVELLCEKAAFLAVNTQKNAGNHGFNTISKYRRADFISVSESELRLDARNKYAPLDDLIASRALELGCRNMVVTRGEQGCVCYSKDEGTVIVPALIGKVRDRVGAGDAMLAITSLLSCLKAPPDVIGLVGNVVGIQAVGMVGNRAAIDRVQVEKHLMHLLK